MALFYLTVVTLVTILAHEHYAVSIQGPICRCSQRALVLLIAICFVIVNVEKNFNTCAHPVAVDGSLRCAGGPGRATVILGAPFSLVGSLRGAACRGPRCVSRRRVTIMFSPLRRTSAAQVFRPGGIIVVVLRDFDGRCVNFCGGSLSNNTCGKCAPFLSSLLRYYHACALSLTSKQGSVSTVPSILSDVPVLVRPFIMAPCSAGTVSSVTSYLHTGSCAATFCRKTPGNDVKFRTCTHTTNFRTCCNVSRCSKRRTFSNA